MKLTLLVAFAALGVIVGVLACAGLMKQVLLDGQISELRTIAEMAKGSAVTLQEQVEKGEMTQDQALTRFARRLRSMTYNGGKGYLFAYRMDGTVIATPDAA